MECLAKNLISFNNCSTGFESDDEQIAVVSAVDKGRALTLKCFPIGDEEIIVFAHNDLLPSLKVGDLVQFDYTKYGALVIDFAYLRRKLQ